LGDVSAAFSSKNFDKGFAKGSLDDFSSQISELEELKAATATSSEEIAKFNEAIVSLEVQKHD